MTYLQANRGLRYDVAGSHGRIEEAAEGNVTTVHSADEHSIFRASHVATVLL